MAQITSANQQKVSNITQKNSDLQSVDQLSSAVQNGYSALVQTKSGAVDAYRTFFLQNNQC